MFQQYIPPTKWWRRQIRIQVTVWPEWLAQLLCPHEHVRPFTWGEKDITVQCCDCYRRITKPNVCTHPDELLQADAFEYEGPHALPFEDRKEIPVGWHCENCGRGFGKYEWCPDCSNDEPMEILGYRGYFPVYFHCKPCNKYVTREELNGQS